MKSLSETLTELGIAFSFPIEIKNANGKRTYYEDSDGYWEKYEYDSKDNETYFENSRKCWYKYEYDDDGNRTYYESGKKCWYKYEYNDDGKETYFESSSGVKRGTPKSAKTREGKVVEVDGIKYKLKTIRWL